MSKFCTCVNGIKIHHYNIFWTDFNVLSTIVVQTPIVKKNRKSLAWLGFEPTSSVITAAALTSELHTIPMTYRNYCWCDFPFKHVSCINELGNLSLVELYKLNMHIMLMVSKYIITQFCEQISSTHSFDTHKKPGGTSWRRESINISLDA